MVRLSWKEFHCTFALPAVTRIVVVVITVIIIIIIITNEYD